MAKLPFIVNCSSQSLVFMVSKLLSSCDSIDLQSLLCRGSDLGNLIGAELVIHTLILLLIFLVTCHGLTPASN